MPFTTLWLMEQHIKEVVIKVHTETVAKRLWQHSLETREIRRNQGINSKKEIKHIPKLDGISHLPSPIFQKENRFHSLRLLIVNLTISLPPSLKQWPSRCTSLHSLGQPLSVCFSFPLSSSSVRLSKPHSSTFPFPELLHPLVVNHCQQDKILNHRGNWLWVVSTRVFLFPGRRNWEKKTYPEGRQHHPRGWGLRLNQPTFISPCVLIPDLRGLLPHAPATSSLTCCTVTLNSEPNPVIPSGILQVFSHSNENSK